ncbi:zonular occludens toxin [Salmonella enterica]
MAITAYIGTPGSGKSYEVVRSVIIPAVCRGRRIVTNIYGLSFDNVIDYCEKKKLIKENISPGEIILVENNRIMEPDFFPIKENQGNSLCRPGDLVILDECHRFFVSDRTISKDARIFAAEHRHYVDSETGFTCDLVLINQALSTLPRFLKERIEQTFRMKKLGALSCFGNKYRVDIFDGVKLTKGSRITFYIESYKSDIYPLYKSHDISGALEVKSDGRGSLIKKSSLVFFSLFLIFAVFLIFRYSYPYFFPKVKNKTPDNNIVKKVKLHSSNEYDLHHSGAESDESPPVSDWCITGQIRRKNGRYIFLKDTAGRIRMVSAYGFTGSGMMLQGVVDGKSVVVWSCNPVFSVSGRGV